MAKPRRVERGGGRGRKGGREQEKPLWQMRGDGAKKEEGTKEKGVGRGLETQDRNPRFYKVSLLQELDTVISRRESSKSVLVNPLKTGILKSWKAPHTQPRFV